MKVFAVLFLDQSVVKVFREKEKAEAYVAENQGPLNNTLQFNGFEYTIEEWEVENDKFVFVIHGVCRISFLKEQLYFDSYFSDEEVAQKEASRKNYETDATDETGCFEVFEFVIE